MQKTSCFGLIIATRGFFNAQLAAGARDVLLSVMEQRGYDYVIVPQDATPCGAIETRRHAKLCADLFKANADEIDGVIVVLPNFGDELGVVQALAPL